MHLPSSLVLLAASLPLGLADQSNKGLNFLAKKAGLKYFGAATDTPGFRERAGHESAYAQYDEIMWDSGEFGQTTPTNGQKVRKPHASSSSSPLLITMGANQLPRSGPLSSPPRAASTTPRVRS